MPTLLGPDGQPIRKTDLLREHATVAQVRPLWSGHPAQGLTPQRLAAILKSAEWSDPLSYLELAEEMEEKDLHYLGVISTRKRQVAQLEITVEAASDDPQDVKSADLVRDWLARDALEDELFDILDAVGKGFSATEILWETSERDWQPKDLVWRDPRWFKPDARDGRTLRLRDQEGDGEGDNRGTATLPPYKYITHRVRAKSGLLLRGGLARAAAWSYLFKNFGLKDWVVFCEAFGQPLRLGKYDPSATAEEKKVLLDAVANIGSDFAAIIPQSMVIEFVEHKLQGRAEIYERLLDWLDRQVSKAVLGQTLTTEVKGEGSYAAAKVHDEVRSDIERADSKALAASLNRDLVRPLIDLNRGPQAAYPRIVIGRPESFDVPVITEALTKLVPLGLQVEASIVRDKLGFPEPAKEAELLAAPPPPPPNLQPPSPGAAGAAPPSPAAGRGRDGVARQAQQISAPDTPDHFAQRLDREAAPSIGRWIEQLRAIVAEAGSLQEIRDRVLDAWPDLDAGDLASVMGLALGASDLAGRYESLSESE